MPVTFYRQPKPRFCQWATIGPEFGKCMLDNGLRETNKGAGLQLGSGMSPETQK